MQVSADECFFYQKTDPNEVIDEKDEKMLLIWDFIVETNMSVAASALAPVNVVSMVDTMLTRIVVFRRDSSRNIAINIIYYK